MIVSTLLQAWLSLQNYHIHILAKRRNHGELQILMEDNNMAVTIIDPHLSELTGNVKNNCEMKKENDKMSKLYFIAPYDDDELLQSIQYLKHSVTMRPLCIDYGAFNINNAILLYDNRRKINVSFEKNT